MDYEIPGANRETHDYLKLAEVASEDITYLEATPAASTHGVDACPQTVNDVAYLNHNPRNKKTSDRHSSRDTHGYLELVDEASDDVTKGEQTAGKDVSGEGNEYNYPTMEETYYEITDDRTVPVKKGKSPRHPRDSLPYPPPEGAPRKVKGKRKVALIAGLFALGNVAIAAIIAVIILTSRDRNKQIGERFQFVVMYW